MKIVSTFKERMCEAMQIRHMKASEISKATHINKSSISNYVNGVNIPYADNLLAIAQCLNVNESWLAGYDCEMERITITNNPDEELLVLANQMTAEQKRKAIQFIKDFIL